MKTLVLALMVFLVSCGGQLEPGAPPMRDAAAEYPPLVCPGDAWGYRG